MREIRKTVLPKQAKFLQSNKKEVLYSGAFRAGKSKALCIKAVERASLPGNVVGLCRKTSTSLKRTTLRTLLNSDGDLPPVLPAGTYEHYKQDKLIKIKNGGEILYFGFDDEETIASLGVGCMCVDEGSELNEDEYTMLLGRISMKTDPLRQLFTATNPSSPHHFLYNRFFKNPTNMQEVVKTKSKDNFFLPKDYLEMLNSFTGQRKARYVEGEWVAFEGLVYDIFNRDDHVMVRDCNFKEIILTLDEGYTNPAVILKCGIDGDGRIHIMKEFYERRILQDRLISEAEDMKGSYSIVDPSAASLIASMESRGLSVEKGNNKVVPGIFAVLNRLKVQKDKLPRLTVDPSCVNTIMEFESYQWKGKDKEEPVKELDHAMDAVRYIIMHLDAGDMLDPHIYGKENKRKKADVKKDSKEYEKIDRKRIEEDDSAWNN